MVADICDESAKGSIGLNARNLEETWWVRCTPDNYGLSKMSLSLCPTFTGKAWQRVCRKRSLDAGVAALRTLAVLLCSFVPEDDIELNAWLLTSVMSQLKDR